MRKLIWIAAIWAAIQCWVGRYAMLDDALIHLRYAAILHDRHRISFDGIHPNYGTSSLLYVAILALLRALTHSALLPKAVSLLAYAGLLTLVYRIARINRLAIALFFVLVSPFAIRWLTDGMETGLVGLLAVAFAMLLFRSAPPLALAAIALLLALLRVDLTLLVAFAVLVFIDRRDWLRAIALCAGSGFGLLFIRVAMGHLLPDTAIAKEGVPFTAVLATTVHEFAATGSFGLGLLLLWALSAAAAARADRRLAWIVNLPFPVLVFMAAAKGQQMNGIRYVIAALLFSIAWNMLLAGASFQPRPVLLSVFLCALALCWIVEFPIVLRIDRGRSQTFLDMRSAHLDRLHGPGIAADVGFIGYFSQAPICDMNGLINGREAALLPYRQRSQACFAANPSFMFLTQLQLGTIDEIANIDTHTDWFDCGSVVFTNVNSTDRHWLLVRRADYPTGCPSHL